MRSHFVYWKVVEQMTGSCVECSFPIVVGRVGREVSCPSCETVNEAVSGPISDVTIPTPMFAFLLGLGIGIVVGPAIIVSTSGGAQWLEKKARERLSA